MSGEADIRADPVLKRPFDVALAVIAIIVTAPLWPLVALTAKIQGRGPIFFTQKRWGKGGSTFELRKFRTMIASSADVPAAQSGPGDPRITTVGRVLRRAGLDELPQLLSILRGDMSFVGPRPLAVGEIVRDGHGNLVLYEDVAGFRERLAVRPGLTGRSTIYLPKDASPEEKFASDLGYIAERSFLGDLKLVAISIRISLTGRWENRSSSP